MIVKRLQSAAKTWQNWDRREWTVLFCRIKSRFCRLFYMDLHIIFPNFQNLYANAYNQVLSHIGQRKII